MDQAAREDDSPPGPGERGRELERRVADYFAVHGYEVRRNAILAGRSGARHEIDVLAERTDAAITVSVAVECKARSEAVATEPVARLDWVVRDLGLDKAVMVCPGGITPAAAESARDLGIEIWDRELVAGRLGAGPLERVASGPRGLAWPPALDEAAARRIVRREGAGLLGLGREVVVNEGVTWLAWNALELSEPAREGLLRPRLRTRRRWVLYDGLAARLVRESDDEPAAELERRPLDGPRLPIATTAEWIAGAIRQAATRRDEVVSEGARRRHQERLEQLGVPPDAEAPRVERRQLVWQPLWLALLDGRRGRRIVAVDLSTGRRDEHVEELLTENLGVVEGALREARD